MGKRVPVKYEFSGGHCEWFEGVVTTYNCMTAKYCVYFPFDKKQKNFPLDIELID